MGRGQQSSLRTLQPSELNAARQYLDMTHEQNLRKLYINMDK